MSYLLDTNICIYALKKRPAAVLERLRRQSPSDVVISVITLLELKHGAEKSQFREKNHATLNAFLEPFDVLPFEELDADAAARIRADLQKAGTPIGDYDCLIAGHALARSLILVSNNLSEFGRVSGLVTENWAMP